MGESSAGAAIATVVIVTAVLAIAAFVFVGIRGRRRLSAMSDAEREHHEAVVMYERNVKAAEKNVSAEMKARGARLKSAQRQLKSSSSVGRKHIGGYSGSNGSVRAFQHELVLPEGTFPMDESVRASVDTAGNLATSSRATLTRMATGGLLLGPVGLLAGGLLKKNKKHDMRELYLLVEGNDFATLVACRPDDGQRVRQLAVAISQAARSASIHRAEHEAAVKAATEQLKIEELNTTSLRAAEKALESVRADTTRVDAALAAISTGTSGGGGGSS